MVERKMFKTKLCMLYRKGHCRRQNCSFAHGNAELRQLSGSANGTRDYRGVDLRDKLDSRLSPQRRYSPRRETRGQRRYHGSSPPLPLEKTRKRRKMQQFDGQSDFSGSLRISEVGEDRAKERTSLSSDSGLILREEVRQLKDLQEEIKMLDHQKSQLRIQVEQKAAEADSLTSRILELEAQLSKEKEECKKITSKIKKFVKAHKHYMWVKAELERSQVQLQKLGDQLGSEAILIQGNEEDSTINIVSDGETIGHQAIVPPIKVQHYLSPSEKILSMEQDTLEESRQANLVNCGGSRGSQTKAVRMRNVSRSDAHPTESNVTKGVEAVDIRSGGCHPTGIEDEKNRRKSLSLSLHSAEKPKGSGPGSVVPPTSIAGHAIDELVEIDGEENIEVVENASAEVEKEVATSELLRLPFMLPPPPPVLQNNYSKYEGEDENVDLEGLEDETEDVEID